MSNKVEQRSSALAAIDGLLADFNAETIGEHLKDVFGVHLRNSEGYNHSDLADEYEILRRIVEALKYREAELLTNK